MPALTPASLGGAEPNQIETRSAFEAHLRVMDDEVQLLQRYLGPQILALFA
jgi:hypothetical protein